MRNITPPPSEDPFTKLSTKALEHARGILLAEARSIQEAVAALRESIDEFAANEDINIKDIINNCRPPL
jgi:hypothetical protein